MTSEYLSEWPKMLEFDCWCFDLDGTLIDIEARFTAIYNDLLMKLGGQPIPDYYHMRRLGNLEPEICQMSGLEKSQLDLYDYYREQMIEDAHYLEYDTVLPGVHSLLNYLHQGKSKIWIVSHRRDSAAMATQLGKLGLDEMVDGWTCTNTDPLQVSPTGKLAMSEESLMAASLFKAKAIKEVGQGRPTVVVGDTPIDIRAAQEAGAKSIAVATGLHDYQSLAKYNPDFVFNSLEEILAALVRGS